MSIGKQVYVIANDDAFYAMDDGVTPLYPTLLSAKAAFMMIDIHGSLSNAGMKISGAYSFAEMVKAMDEDGIPWKLMDAHDPLGVDSQETNS